MATFFRLDSDQKRLDAALENQYLSAWGSACWLIGGGPSLAELPIAEIARSPIPKMAINNSGAKLIRPNFWTSYDPTSRFLRSIYLDASVTKFVHRRRAMDLAPECSYKVFDCPNTVFFEREAGRTFGSMLSPESDKVIDWCDSMIQAIDILYRLGFRRVYLAGCELRIHPSDGQVAFAQQKQVTWNDEGTLADFIMACELKGISREDLERAGPISIYHFDETKPMAATIQTDQHYYRVSQYLRLSRRNLSQHGMELISVTRGSRLNEYFPYRDAQDVVTSLHDELGDAREEETRGLYSRQQRAPSVRGPMRDFRPPNLEEPRRGTGTPGRRELIGRPMNSWDHGKEREILFEQTGRFSRRYVPPTEEG